MAKINSKIIPRGKNSQSSKQIFEEREDYREYAFEGLEEIIPEPIDVWYDKPLYGKVDLEYNAIFLSRQYLKKLSGSKTETFAVNFVADAFHDLREYMHTAANKGKISTEKTKFLEIEPKKGWRPIQNIYSDHLNSLYGGFASNFVLQDNNEQKLINFKDFMDLFWKYLKTLQPDVPCTQTGFMMSRFCPLFVTGLVIEISDALHGNDEVKYEEYIKDINFLFYAQAAKKFGFRIDKNAPWRLVADLKSNAMKEYMLKYPEQPASPVEPGDQPAIPNALLFFSNSIGQEVKFDSGTSQEKTLKPGIIKSIITRGGAEHSKFKIVEKQQQVSAGELPPVGVDEEEPIARINSGYLHFEETLLVSQPPMAAQRADMDMVAPGPDTTANSFWYLNKSPENWGIRLSAEGSVTGSRGEHKYIWEQTNGKVPEYLKKALAPYPDRDFLLLYPDSFGHYDFSLQIQTKDGKVSAPATARIKVCQMPWEQGGTATPTKPNPRNVRPTTSVIDRNKYATWHWLNPRMENERNQGIYGNIGGTLSENIPTNEHPPGMFGWLTQFARIPIDPGYAAKSQAARDLMGKTERDLLLKDQPMEEFFMDGYRGSGGCWFPYVLKNNIGMEAWWERGTFATRYRDSNPLPDGDQCSQCVVENEHDPRYREWCEIDTIIYKHGYGSWLGTPTQGDFNNAYLKVQASIEEEYDRDRERITSEITAVSASGQEEIDWLIQQGTQQAEDIVYRDFYENHSGLRDFVTPAKAYKPYPDENNPPRELTDQYQKWREQFPYDYRNYKAIGGRDPNPSGAYIGRAAERKARKLNERRHIKLRDDLKQRFEIIEDAIAAIRQATSDKEKAEQELIAKAESKGVGTITRTMGLSPEWALGQLYWKNWQAGKFDYLKERYFSGRDESAPFAANVNPASDPGSPHGIYGDNGCPEDVSAPLDDGIVPPQLVFTLSTLDAPLQLVPEELIKPITDFSPPNFTTTHMDNKKFQKRREEFQKQIDAYPVLFDIWHEKYLKTLTYDKVTFPEWQLLPRLGFDNLFKEYYQKTYEQDIITLKNFVLDFYNSFVIQNPSVTLVKINKCNDGTANQNVKRQMITEEEMKEVYPDVYWVMFYASLRLLEAGIEMSEAEQKSFFKKAKDLSQLNPDTFSQKILKIIEDKTKGVIKEKLALTPPDKHAIIFKTKNKQSL